MATDFTKIFKDELVIAGVLGMLIFMSSLRLSSITSVNQKFKVHTN